MFNAIRPVAVPACLAKNEYNTEEIVNILENIFYGKCYLCEQDRLTDPEIEHLDPHKGVTAKKFDWLNLFYACGRCNSIKGHVHVDILNCCNPLIDIFREIRCTLPSTPDDLVQVSAIDQNCSQETKNTVALLAACYNEKNTALRNLTRISMMESLYIHYAEFIALRMTIVDKRSSMPERSFAKEKMEVMLDVSFPFSIFWRWHLLSDTNLLKHTNDLVKF